VVEDKCLEAVQLVRPAGATPESTTLATGTWGQRPPGCSMRSGSDWLASYNRFNGDNNGKHTPVCSSQCRGDASTFVMGTKGAATCNTGQVAVSSAEQCAQYASNNGRIVEAACQTSNNYPNWCRNTPVGCWHKSDGSYWYNKGPSGKAFTEATPVCCPSTEAPTLLGAANTNECPSGYTKILSKSACHEAATDLGIPIGSYNGGETTEWNKPSGCFKKIQSNTALYNNHHSGQADPQIAPICHKETEVQEQQQEEVQADYLLGVANTNECQSGYTKIPSKPACHEAATALSIEIDSYNDGETTSSAKPSGCFINKWNKALYNNHPTGGSDEHSAPICKKEIQACWASRSLLEDRGKAVGWGIEPATDLAACKEMCINLFSAGCNSFSYCPSGEKTGCWPKNKIVTLTQAAETDTRWTEIGKCETWYEVPCPAPPASILEVQPERSPRLMRSHQRESRWVHDAGDIRVV